MITGIHLQLVVIVIGLLTAYMVHSNGMVQVNKLETGHPNMLKKLDEIEKRFNKILMCNVRTQI